MKKIDAIEHFGNTISLCEECLVEVPTTIFFEGENVFYLKECAEHGKQKTLISTDKDYYLLCQRADYSISKPTKWIREETKKCPHDCGLCRAHMKHTAMGIIEVLDECNMRCPTCIATSFPGAGKIKKLDEIEKMIDVLVDSEIEPDLVMISGGEPTIHPKILDILRLAKTKPIKHLMLISNGVRLAKDIKFVEALKEFKENFEVYLQFDSLDPLVLTDIRGEDLSDVRLKAIRNLEEAEIHSTLICVVKNNLNEHEMNKVIDFALGFKFIRGVTFQPCKVTGRHDTAFDKYSDYITLSSVRTNIIQNSIFFKSEDIIPHPLNPNNICIGYLQKTKEGIRTITKDIFKKPSLENEELQAHIDYKSFIRKMYFSPDQNLSAFKYEDLFRVTIVSLLDKFNFCTTSVKDSCIHFVSPNYEIIPIDTYYLFYQEKT